MKKLLIMLSSISLTAVIPSTIVVSCISPKEDNQLIIDAKEIQTKFLYIRNYNSINEVTNEVNKHIEEGESGIEGIKYFEVNSYPDNLTDVIVKVNLKQGYKISDNSFVLKNALVDKTFKTIDLSTAKVPKNIIPSNIITKKQIIEAYGMQYESLKGMVVGFEIKINIEKATDIKTGLITLEANEIETENAKLVSGKKEIVIPIISEQYKNKFNLRHLELIEMPVFALNAERKNMIEKALKKIDITAGERYKVGENWHDGNDDEWPDENHSDKPTYGSSDAFYDVAYNRNWDYPKNPNLDDIVRLKVGDTITLKAKNVNHQGDGQGPNIQRFIELSELRIKVVE